jgi:tetratricopeptide (TPR) repeat protein
VYRALGDANGATRALSGLATVATYQGDYAAAREHNQEALAAYRDQGNHRGAALTLHNLGFISLCEGDPAAAVDHYTQALGLLRDTGDLKQVALTLADLAVASVRLERDENAAAQALASLAIVRDLASAREGAYALEGTAELAVMRGEAGRGARFLGAARRLREETGAALSPAEERQQSALLERIRGISGAPDLEAGLAEGASLGFDVAVTEATEWLQASGN